MNSLFQQLNPQNNQSLLKNNNLNTLINTFKNSTNPRQLVMNLVRKNPQISALLQNSNKSPKQLFFEIAQQQGVDPDSILKLLQ